MTDGSRPVPIRMSAPEFLTLRTACALTQKAAAEHLGVAMVTVQQWERGARRVDKSAGDALKNLDDLIRARVDVMLRPILRQPPAGPVLLHRYRSAEEYQAHEPGNVAAGLPFSAHAALLWRLMDGLTRLKVRYVVDWPPVAEKADNAK